MRKIKAGLLFLVFPIFSWGAVYSVEEIEKLNNEFFLKEQFLYAKFQVYRGLADNIIRQSEFRQAIRNKKSFGSDRNPKGNSDAWYLHFRPYADPSVRFLSLKLKWGGNLVANIPLLGRGQNVNHVGWYSIEIPPLAIGIQAIEVELEVSESKSLEPFQGLARKQTLKATSVFHRPKAQSKGRELFVLAHLKRTHLFSTDLEMQLETISNSETLVDDPV